METMKTHAMLELQMFTSSRRFTDWIIQYLEEMRSKIAQASVYQGEQRSPKGKDSARDTRESQRDTRETRDTRRESRDSRRENRDTHDSRDNREPFKETSNSKGQHKMAGADKRQEAPDPCEGCGAAHRHAFKGRPAVDKEDCPSKSTQTGTKRMSLSRRVKLQDKCERITSPEWTEMGNHTSQGK